VPEETWTPLKLLNWTQGFFAAKGVDAPRLTAELLLATALGCDRVRLYLDFDKPIGEPELVRYRELVKRRAGGEPTAYLTGAREFFGHRLAVDARVLIPRPRPSCWPRLGLAALPAGGAVLDLGTGSGALAIALALARPTATVTAVDLSPGALEWRAPRRRARAAVASSAATSTRRCRRGPASTSSSPTRPTSRPASSAACSASAARAAAGPRRRADGLSCCGGWWPAPRPGSLRRPAAHGDARVAPRDPAGPLPRGRLRQRRGPARSSGLPRVTLARMAAPAPAA